MGKDCVAERWCKEGHSTGVSFAFIYSSSSRLCLVDFAGRSQVGTIQGADMFNY